MQNLFVRKKILSLSVQGRKELTWKTCRRHVNSQTLLFVYWSTGAIILSRIVSENAADDLSRLWNEAFEETKAFLSLNIHQKVF